MGSITNEKQVDLDAALKERDERLGISHKEKAMRRNMLEGPGIPESKSISCAASLISFSSSPWYLSLQSNRCGFMVEGGWNPLRWLSVYTINLPSPNIKSRNSIVFLAFMSSNLHICILISYHLLSFVKASTPLTWRWVRQLKSQKESPSDFRSR